MKILKPAFSPLFVLFAALVMASSGFAQQPAPQQAASKFDVTNYRIEAQLIPDQHLLRAGADITVVPLDWRKRLIG